MKKDCKTVLKWTGEKEYVLVLENRGIEDIFDYDNELKIGSVKEQEEFYENWIESLSK